MQRGGRISRSSFSNPKEASYYVDSAIAHNIQHGLEYYRDGRNMRNLVELWDADELTNAVNRVVQQENHLFARKSINGVFKSRDLGSAIQILRNRMGDASPLDASVVDTGLITSALMRVLDVYNPESLTVEVGAAALSEIRSWLHVIEVFSSYEVRSLDPDSSPSRAEVVTQPGLRYSQALELIEVLRRDSSLSALPVDEQALVFDTIERDILGRMLEEVVVHETDMARGGWEWRPSSEEPDTRLEVFKLMGSTLPSGKPCPYEFDMVTYDHVARELDLFEVRHSDQVVMGQTRHLTNKEVLEALRKRYGANTTIRRHVLYRGQTLADPLGVGVEYTNVEEYLTSLWADR